MLFANFDNAPSLETIGNRLQGASVSYDRYSYGKLRISYDTVTVTLPQDRNKKKPLRGNFGEREGGLRA